MTAPQEFRTRLRFKPGVERVLTIKSLEPRTSMDRGRHYVIVSFVESSHRQSWAPRYSGGEFLEEGMRVRVKIRCFKSHGREYLDYKIIRIMQPEKGTIFEQLLRAGRALRRDLPKGRPKQPLPTSGDCDVTASHSSARNYIAQSQRLSELAGGYTPDSLAEKGGDSV